MPSSTLAELRAHLEAIDSECVALLARRVDVARQVGAYKRAHGLATLDAGREARVVALAARIGREAGLEEEDVRGIYWQIVAMSRCAQQDAAS